MIRCWQRFVETPVGTMWLVADEHALRVAVFADGHEATPAGLDDLVGGPCAIVEGTCEALDRAADALADFWAGDVAALDTVPVAPHGTKFQHAVWDVLRTIPHGKTLTYGEVARRIDRPSASRAVGAANHVNPIALFIPCHRVIGSGGRLVGYGGGLDRKQRLLEHEGALAPAMV
jgi:methylated-DNA-[protein]-cysteine S-methyltransferase